MQMSATTRTEVSSGIYACCQTHSFLAIQLIDKQTTAPNTEHAEPSPENVVDMLAEQR
jgi:hypothetical protein